MASSSATSSQGKRRVLRGSTYSELQRDGYWHLGCTCSTFHATSAGNLPWCDHLANLISDHLDLEVMGFSNLGTEKHIHVTLRNQKPYLDTLITVSDPDGHGMRRAEIASVLHGEDVGIDFTLGYVHQSTGRFAIIPLVREWLNEHMDVLREVGCRHAAHQISRYDALPWDMLDKHDPLLWADLLDIANRAICRTCRELDDAQDIPF